jgi:hypothetical protein
VYTRESNGPIDFEGDAFISYSHLDNVELVEGRKGWVACLHRALEVRVAQLLGKEPEIWRDPRLHGNDQLTDTLVDKVRRVASLVAVISPRYVRSEWTRMELREFWTAAEAQGGVHVRNKSRVFKVLKTPVPREETPPELRDLLGYEFYKVDPETGRVRELDEVFGPEAQREFWLRLDDLAYDVCALLRDLESPSQEPAEERNDAIYLAESTSDMKEEREALRRDLQQHGYRVLPETPLPLVASEAEAAVLGDLTRSRMSVHLVGRNYGVVPEGGTRSLIEMQHELATERAQGSELSRIVWLPAGQRVDDARQRELVERLRQDSRITGSADLLESSFEDLRTAVHGWLTSVPESVSHGPPVATAAGSAPPLLYLVADPRDEDAITPWGHALHDEQLEVVWPLFRGDEAEIREYHEENLRTCDGVLIFYGSGNEAWLRRKLGEIQKSPGYGRTGPAPTVGVCLLPPTTPEKERLRTHAAMLIPQWDGYAGEALRPFVSRLKEGRPV